MMCFKRFYQGIILIGDNFKHLFLLMVRLYWGVLFFLSGWGKFVNHGNVVDFFQSLHIPLPAVNAYLAASSECIGGFCLVIGFASRLMSLPLIFTMIIAYLTAHSESVNMIFQDPNQFTMQSPFNFLMASLMIFSFGPGAFSSDALIKTFNQEKK